ncbi:Undecaprenyl phosphate N,N'-diacetylbacillosamine 1-phosphate transferase [Pontiella desulfatans]|uniref:Undecaprenyl phosphate N,N'-diacetylbacillosamine 1-phosphate transferase n=1 Tax=Pontiella desulfatans TaxID=2750659 RepID=A0A6C2U6Y1_PONDE|nr:sugar transferase [Pontiella desulfatans]VGO15609.1 Undecaprenyl phosphate N,N'-diacetylbacillosamine 1-phosphate transferase [Pontiella desulfatans]
MKRFFDIVVSLSILVVFSPVFVLCALAVRFTSKGPVFYVSDRIGANNSHFNMIKFRTMRIDTPQVATHLMTDPKAFLTPVGDFLRKSSLDELPQLINVLKGEMSIVGPRPALFNQDDQISLRTEAGCHVLVPGITGWAQVNGRDDIPIVRKVELDTWYFHNRSFALDMKIILLTAWHVVWRKDVSH